MEKTNRDQLCILVVDDDPSIRSLIVTTLRRDGYKLTEARNGREALDAMRSGDDDLVLLDLMMPEVSGWDVLQVRRKDAELRRTPVIVISAAHALETDELVAADVCAVLRKPFELTALHKLVKDCLAHSHDAAKPE